MTRWLTLHRDDVPVVFFTIGSLGLSIIMLMSIILFYRVLQSDFLNSKNSIIVMNSNDNPKKENSSTNGYRSFDQIISRWQPISLQKIFSSLNWKKNHTLCHFYQILGPWVKKKSANEAYKAFTPRLKLRFWKFALLMSWKLAANFIC